MGGLSRDVASEPEPAEAEAETEAEAEAEAEPETGSSGDGNASEAADTAEAPNAARAEIARLEDRFLRARADYENLVKRTEREREDARRAAAARVIEALLTPLEVLDRALLDLAESGDDARVRGLHLAVAAIKEALEREGLEAVPGAGERFDHTVHEAVARESAQAAAGTVTEVIRTGYRLDGRLLRPALVKVSTGPASEKKDE